MKLHEFLTLVLANLENQEKCREGDSEARWEVEDRLISLIGQGIEGFEHLGTGRNRACFARPGDDYVIKIPVNSYGVMNNYDEAGWFAKFRNRMARSRIVRWAGLPVLVMERVTTGFTYPDLPEWSDWVDCQQVGKTKRGVFVAYDYAGGVP